jgi:hypothetical protein
MRHDFPRDEQDDVETHRHEQVDLRDVVEEMDRADRQRRWLQNLTIAVVIAAWVLSCVVAYQLGVSFARSQQ